MITLRDLINKAGVVFDADKLTILFAEDWADIKSNFNETDSRLNGLSSDISSINESRASMDRFNIYNTLSLIVDLVFSIHWVGGDDYFKYINTTSLTTSRTLYADDNPYLLDVVFQNLTTVTGDFGFSNCTNVTRVLCMNLNSITGDLYLNTCTGVSETDFTNLHSVNRIFANLGFSYGGISFPTLTSCQQIFLSDNPNISSFDFSLITDLVLIGCSNCSSLSSVTMGSLATYQSISFDGCALDETNIDYILAQVDAGGATGGSMNLSGGTNSAPSSAGLVSKANLEAKGWNVVVNS